MTKVIICRGIQGSGKSTWASNWVQKDPANRIRINWDELRLMMGGGPDGYWVPKREKMPVLSRILELMITTAIEYEKDIVIDNMNLNPNTVNDIIGMVSRSSQYTDEDKPVEVYVKSFYTDVDVCVERDSKRTRPVTENVIRACYARYPEYFAHTDNITKTLPEYTEE